MKTPRSKTDVLAIEAESLVALSFRNGPIEDVHAGEPCPTCCGKSQYSRITNVEMRRIMRNAVDWVYTLLWFREHAPDDYATFLQMGMRDTEAWDEPKLVRLPRTIPRKSGAKPRFRLNYAAARVRFFSRAYTIGPTKIAMAPPIRPKRSLPNNATRAIRTGAPTT